MQSMRYHYEQEVLPSLRIQSHILQQNKKEQRDAIIEKHHQDIRDWVNFYEKSADGLN